MKISIHDPYTVTLARGLRERSQNQARAKDGYICYATLRAPSNAASSHPGFGMTPADAAEAARYWANQAPWVRIVPLSRAPDWAVEQALGHPTRRKPLAPKASHANEDS